MCDTATLLELSSLVLSGKPTVIIMPFGLNSTTLQSTLCTAHKIKWPYEELDGNIIIVSICNPEIPFSCLSGKVLYSTADLKHKRSIQTQWHSDGGHAN